MSKVGILIDTREGEYLVQVEDIHQADIVAFRRAAEKLNRIMKRVTKYNPHAEIYVDGTANMNLMRGPSHTGPKGHAHYEHVVETVAVKNLDGGDW